MVIDELDNSASFRLARILRVLESMYGLTINFGAGASAAELQEVYEEFGLVRAKIISEAHFNTYTQDSEYAKACLIQEAIKIFLSEVAPKRIRRKK